jgi:hypothetical protein
MMTNQLDHEIRQLELMMAALGCEPQEGIRIDDEIYLFWRLV